MARQPGESEEAYQRRLAEESAGFGVVRRALDIPVPLAGVSLLELIRRNAPEVYRQIEGWDRQIYENVTEALMPVLMDMLFSREIGVMESLRLELGVTNPLSDRSFKEMAVVGLQADPATDTRGGTNNPLRARIAAIVDGGPLPDNFEEHILREIDAALTTASRTDDALIQGAVSNWLNPALQGVGFGEGTAGSAQSYAIYASKTIHQRIYTRTLTELAGGQTPTPQQIAYANEVASSISGLPATVNEQGELQFATDSAILAITPPRGYFAYITAALENSQSGRPQINGVFRPEMISPTTGLPGAAQAIGDARRQREEAQAADAREFEQSRAAAAGLLTGLSGPDQERVLGLLRAGAADETRGLSLDEINRANARGVDWSAVRRQITGGEAVTDIEVSDTEIKIERGANSTIIQLPSR